VLLQTCEEIVRGVHNAAELKAASTASGMGADGQRPAALGADDLLPLSVYVVIRSRMSALPGELLYIASFLPDGHQHGSLGYALTSLQCACRVALDLRWDCDSLIRSPEPASSL